MLLKRSHAFSCWISIKFHEESGYKRETYESGFAMIIFRFTVEKARGTMR